MSEPPTGEGPPPGRERRIVAAYHSRSERRSARRLARRRERATRLLYVLVPTVVVVVAAALLFTFLGGSGSEGSPAGSTALTAAPPTNGGSGLLVVRQGGTTVAAFLLYSGPKGGVVLGIPGVALLRDGHRFSTVAAIAAAGGTGSGGDGSAGQALAGAVSSALGVPVAASAWVEWAGLRTVLEGAGGGLPPAGLELQGGDAGRVAAVLALLLTQAGSQGGGRPWEEDLLSGEAGPFQTVLDAVLQATAGSAWSGVAVAGVMAGEGEAGQYLEPDLSRAKAALAGVDADTPVVVELQNGSGVAGVTELANQLLAGLGYDFLPARNAEGFPDVAATRILAAPDVVLQAEVVQRSLGVGTVLRDRSLAPGRVVVVLGKDFPSEE